MKQVRRQGTKKGFTLIEVLVATFVFVIAMSTISQIFVSMFSVYRQEKMIQNNLEDAQFAMNTFAKALRGSSITSSYSSQTSVAFYNYAEDRCFFYSITTTAGVTVLQSAPLTVNSTKNGCIGTASTFTDIVKVDSGSFSVTSSVLGTTVGKVTMALQVGSVNNHPVSIQTTVSLRDYEVSGL